MGAAWEGQGVGRGEGAEREGAAGREAEPAQAVVGPGMAATAVVGTAR